MLLLSIIITYTQISCGLMGKSRIFGVLQCVFESRQDKGGHKFLVFTNECSNHSKIRVSFYIYFYKQKSLYFRNKY